MKLIRSAECRKLLTMSGAAQKEGLGHDLYCLLMSPLPQLCEKGGEPIFSSALLRTTILRVSYSLWRSRPLFFWLQNKGWARSAVASHSRFTSQPIASDHCLQSHGSKSQGMSQSRF